MGAGGRMTVAEQQAPISNNHANKTRRSPSEKPPFTLGQLRSAIPPHCFDRSLIRSFSWLVHDLIITSIFFYFALRIIPHFPEPLQFVAWPLYWALQGSILTGIWVIGHECGHHAFSKYTLVDDIVGFISHTFLLVPYFSWRISHRRHHANTGSLENDEVYVPKLKSRISWYNDDFKYLHTAPGRAFTLLITIILGFPMYLLFNVSGRKYPRWTSHFDPYSPLYNDRERKQVIISDIGILAMLAMIHRVSVEFGFWWMMRVYGVPLLIVNGFFVIITYLHHTHRSLPRFDSTEWDFLRGALSTIDRDFGVLNHVFHDVTHTHVLHHIFSMIPHYHAMEAFLAIKPILGDYYHIDRTPIIKALWREARECLYVEADEDEKNKKGVYWFTSKF